MFRGKRNKQLHTIKCKRYISKRYFTMVIIHDPTKKAKTVQLPKWIRFPMFLAAVLIVVAAIWGMGYMAKLEISTAKTNVAYQKIRNDNTKYQQEIARLEREKKDQLNQLLTVKEQSEQLIAKYEELDKMQLQIAEKINSTVKTTDQEKGDPLDLSRVPNDNSLRYAQKPVQSLSSGGQFDHYFQQVKEYLDQMKLQAEKEEQQVQQIDLKANETLAFWNAVPNGYPVAGRLTCGYKYRIHPIYKTQHFHAAIDLAIASGTPVKATGGGKVIHASWDGDLGNQVTIDHGFNLKTVYGHNSKLLVKVGDIVKRGDVIALVGTTGASTGPHVHYEVIKNGIQVNPLNYMYKEKGE